MLYLLRHGQTAHNLQKRMQGSLDSPLTALGTEQARTMGRALRALIPDLDGWTIETSPLRRALATAEIIRDELGVETEIRVDERLREVSLGSWEGLTRAEIDARWPDARIGTSARQAWAYRCPDGEPLEAVRRRLSDWLDGVREDSRIVVTHGIAGSVLRGLYAGLPDEEMLRLPVPQDVFFELRRGAIRPMGAPT